MLDKLQSIKPTSKALIIDVVEAVGINVSQWRASGPANPSYCYHWAFADTERENILFCLWYDDCIVEDGLIFQAWNFRDYIRKLESNGGPKAGRAREVDIFLQDAWRKRIPVRVAIVDETDKKKANKKEGEPSEAAFRELDPEPWHVAHYDWMTGECKIVRGVATESFGEDLGQQVAEELQAESGSLGDGSSGASEGLLEDLLTQSLRDDIPETTRDALIKARVGQGSFRRSLLKAWDGECAVSACSELAVLRASHIKPWRSCSDFERLDPANGLLLTANLDALFDQGFISFGDGGTMMLSRQLSRKTVVDLELPQRLRKPLSVQQKLYLRFHRDERFRQ